MALTKASLRPSDCDLPASGDASPRPRADGHEHQPASARDDEPRGERPAPEAQPCAAEAADLLFEYKLHNG